jgi:phosphoglycerate dehydrogenase-like enzyme
MSTILFGWQPEKLSEAQAKQIKRLAPNMDLLVTEDRAEVEVRLDDIEIAARRFPHDLVKKAPKLRWIQQWGAGADWLLRHDDVAALDVVVTNASGVHPIQITEHIFAFLLAFARQLHYAVRAQARHEWRRPNRDDFTTDQPFFELPGKTMLVVGVGAIGARTAEIAKAMGMRVLGVRRSPEVRDPNIESMFGPDQLAKVLPEADFVVITVPLTPETMGMIGEPELRAMKPTAYIVNIGRGRTIQEETLIRALQEGWIAGAGLDVFDAEPLPETSPLWDIENVIITAHYAGLTPHYEERAMSIFLENLERYNNGQQLRNVVDKKLAY